jgi:hypothetical protein
MVAIDRPVDHVEITIDLTVNCPPGAPEVDTIIALPGHCSHRSSEDGRVVVRFRRTGTTTREIVDQIRDEIEQRAGVAVVAAAPAP